ncbi:MAG: hypothetical protein GY896_07310 [Gammaproteobacteria bacterium]|nr:hypothetical protein [Gammaproteobacteria bacterium]MCP4981797.1 hypothetical protein [Gammaproteobacteria bacterium]
MDKDQIQQMLNAIETDNNDLRNTDIVRWAGQEDWEILPAYNNLEAKTDRDTVPADSMNPD